HEPSESEGDEDEEAELEPGNRGRFDRERTPLRVDGLGGVDRRIGRSGHLGGFGGSLRIHALSSFLDDVRPSGGGAGVCGCDSTPGVIPHYDPRRHDTSATRGRPGSSTRARFGATMTNSCRITVDSNEGAPCPIAPQPPRIQQAAISPIPTTWPSSATATPSSGR